MAALAERRMTTTPSGRLRKLWKRQNDEERRSSAVPGKADRPYVRAFDRALEHDARTRGRPRGVPDVPRPGRERGDLRHRARAARDRVDVPHAVALAREGD